MSAGKMKTTGSKIVMFLHRGLIASYQLCPAPPISLVFTGRWAVQTLVVILHLSIYTPPPRSACSRNG